MVTFVPPILSEFTSINSESGTSAVDSGDGITIIDSAHTTLDARLLTKAAPATPYTIDTFFKISSFLKDNISIGIGFRDSGNGNFHVMTWRAASGVVQLYDQRYSTPNSFNSGSEIKTIPTWTRGYLRMEDDGTNIKFHYSQDGENYNQIESLVRTTHLSTLDHVCIYWQARNNGGGTDAILAKIFHWEVG